MEKGAMEIPASILFRESPCGRLARLRQKGTAHNAPPPPVYSPLAFKFGGGEVA
jgi:hypothetical protein